MDNTDWIPETIEPKTEDILVATEELKLFAVEVVVFGLDAVLDMVLVVEAIEGVFPVAAALADGEIMTIERSP
jgi:hypothetical protein